MSPEAAGRPSTPALFADALAQMTTLFETELRLVRTEIGEKIHTAVMAIVVIVLAAILLLAALFLVLIGCVELIISFGFQSWVAYFMVGAGIAIVGVVALLLALRNLSADTLKPSRTIAQLGKDADIVKEQVR